jgi:hypothetical protein
MQHVSCEVQFPSDTRDRQMLLLQTPRGSSTGHNRGVAAWGTAGSVHLSGHVEHKVLHLFFKKESHYGELVPNFVSPCVCVCLLEQKIEMTCACLCVFAYSLKTDRPIGTKLAKLCFDSKKGIQNGRNFGKVS